MRNCENCGSLIPEDAPYCYYCGQKVNIKTQSPTPNKDEMVQPPTTNRDAVEGRNQPLPPAPPTNPAGSARSANPVLLVVLIIAVISALVLGGVIAVNAFTHPPSAVTPGVTPSPKITSKPGSQVTPTVSPQAKPTTPTSSEGNPVPITVDVSPNGFSQTSCHQNNDTSWTCTATVTETAGSQSVNWSVTSSFNDVTFSPLNGSVSIDNPNKVSITIPANDCQKGTFTFNFTGGVNSIAKSWSCVPPTLTVTPPSLGVKDCSSLGNGFQCTVKLSDDQGGAKWIASSDLNGVTFTPASDIVYPSGETVTITFVSCSVKGTFIFKGPGNNATVSWVPCIT